MRLSSNNRIAGKSARRPARTAPILLGLTGLLSLASMAGAQTGQADLQLQVIDENNQPVARAEIVVHTDTTTSQTEFSDATGHFDFPGLPAIPIHVTISKPGFFRIEEREIDLTPGSNDVSITLNHETELQQELNVQSQPVQIDPDTTSHQESLVQHEIENTPVPASHDLQQSLRTIPQVVADTNGRLHVAGGRQGQTEVLLDGFEINDPGTGAFTSTINVDAVRDVSVETGGFGSQYSHAGAGLILLDTQSGDDHLRFGATNFIPEASLQQGIHFGNWYPRITFSGPLEKGKAWFSEAFTIQHTFRLISGLPSGQNIDAEWSGDNLLRAQWNLTSRNTLYVNFLYNRHAAPHQGLSTISPESTTQDVEAHRYFVSIKDQIWFGHTLFEVGAAVDTGQGSSTPQGTASYVVTPSSNSGNYFQALVQNSRRLQSVGDITSGSQKWLGSHTLSAGWNVDGLDFSQAAKRAEIDFLRADGTLSERATFSGPAVFRMANTQVGGYVQDLWRPWKPVVISAGVRADWDRLIHRQIVEPRVAMNWVPANGSSKLTLAWGEHYQPLNLAQLGQGYDQSRTDVFYYATGTVALGPPIVSSFLVPIRNLLQPRSYNTTAEWDQKFSSSAFLGAAFLLRESRDGLAWETQPSGSFLLQNNRTDRYISGEVWWRQVFGERAELRIDYTRSGAHSTQALDPTLAQLILAPQEPGPLLWDAPNRVVGAGWTPIPFWGLLLSGLLEYRTGFPFSVINEQQQLIGPVNGTRYPNYFSLNLGLEKRFRFRGHEWAIRVSGVNLTGHANPDTVVNNIDAPNFLTFSGGQARAFTARIRLITQH